MKNKLNHFIGNYFSFF